MQGSHGEAASWAQQSASWTPSADRASHAVRRDVERRVQGRMLVLLALQRESSDAGKWQTSQGASEPEKSPLSTDGAARAVEALRLSGKCSRHKADSSFAYISVPPDVRFGSSRDAHADLG